MSGRIVVGVDGSEPAVDALRWALAEATLREASVDVVHAWHYPYVGDISGMASMAVDPNTLETAGRELLERALEQAGPVPAGVEVTPLLAQGSAAWALLDAAARADLLVVGSRGHGGFTGLLLGSVSQQCAHHAPCPVVIIPHD